MLLASPPHGLYDTCTYGNWSHRCLNHKTWCFWELLSRASRLHIWYFWELISWHLDPIYFSYRNCGIVINGISSQEILSKSSNPIYDVCGKGSIEHFNPIYNIMGIDLIGNSTPIYDAYGNCSHDILISFYNWSHGHHNFTVHVKENWYLEHLNFIYDAYGSWSISSSVVMLKNQNKNHPSLKYPFRL